MLWAQSTTKNYIRAEHKLHSISKLFISQVIITQVMFFEPIYIPRALNTGTCLRQGDRFHSAGLDRNHVLATANTGEIGKPSRTSPSRWRSSSHCTLDNLWQDLAERWMANPVDPVLIHKTSQWRHVQDHTEHDRLKPQAEKISSPKNRQASEQEGTPQSRSST